MQPFNRGCPETECHLDPVFQGPYSIAEDGENNTLKLRGRI